jgi:hypothetical protein
MGSRGATYRELAAGWWTRWLRLVEAGVGPGTFATVCDASRRRHVMPETRVRRALFVIHPVL